MLFSKFRKEKKYEGFGLTKDDWIVEYGSDRLRKLQKLGYEYEQLYVFERTRMEFPEFKLVHHEELEKVSTPRNSELTIQENLIMKGFFSDVVYLNPSNSQEKIKRAVIVENYCDSGKDLLLEV